MTAQLTESIRSLCTTPQQAGRGGGMSEPTHYASQAKEIIRRWEFRMVASARSADGMRAQGRTPDPKELDGMVKQAHGELTIARVAEEAEPMLRRDEATARVKTLDAELKSLGIDRETITFGPRTDGLPRTRVIVAIALTIISAVIAAFAVGAFTGNHSTNTMAAQIATVAMGALVGGFGGYSLASNRTPLVTGVAAAGLFLGTAAAWLVGWVAGVGQPNRLLLALLFLVVAVLAAAAWAMAFLGREPRDRDAQEIAVARRLSERGALLEQQAAAEARLAAIGVAWDAATEEVEGVRGRATV